MEENKKEKMSYEEYRIIATKEDIKKLEKRIKPFWWENIVIIGCILYEIRLEIQQMDIDRGALRKEILKYNIIFVFALLGIIYVILTIITPWFRYSIYKIAINKTNDRIEKNDI